MSWYCRDVDDQAKERRVQGQRDIVPLYARGVDRAKAEELARLFMGRYQPPIECAHRMTHWAVGYSGVKHLKWRQCELCGWFEGVLRKAV